MMWFKTIKDIALLKMPFVHYVKTVWNSLFIHESEREDNNLPMALWTLVRRLLPFVFVTAIVKEVK